MSPTKEQLIDKLLLDYKCELSGMIAENTQREYEGNAMAFPEDSFVSLQKRFQVSFDELCKYQGE